VILEIRDTGCGISENDLPRIFEQFYRGENNENSRGFGLGLSIVKRIVEIHAGTIEIESHFGQGTTVRMRLPILQEQHV
jgi:signal transduction histidine kinase